MVVFPGLCPDLMCPFLPQASACWPGAMRWSLKRSVTAALAASFLFLLLLLLLQGGSWQEQDPLEVSPPPVMSHWRGHWSILRPHLPHTDPHPSSAPFPAPYHLQTPALYSLPGVALCTWASPPVQKLGGQDRGSLSFLGPPVVIPPCSLVSIVLWGLTWLPAAPIQVELGGLAPATVLQILQPEGAQRILRDTDDLSALHNVSYHLLAGSLSPHKSEWLWDPGLSRTPGLHISPIAAACRSMDLPHHCCFRGEAGSASNLFGLRDLLIPGGLPLTTLCCSACEDGGVEEGPRAPSMVHASAPWYWGDRRHSGFPRSLWGGWLRSHLPGVVFSSPVRKVEMVGLDHQHNHIVWDMWVKLLDRCTKSNLHAKTMGGSLGQPRTSPC